MKTKFGHMPCPDCGLRVVVKISDIETLSYGCDECDSNGYCRKGEGRYPLWLKKIERIKPPAAPAPAAAAPPTPAKPTAPAAVVPEPPKKKPSGLLIS